jgi:hypothetical protein
MSGNPPAIFLQGVPCPLSTLSYQGLMGRRRSRKAAAPGTCAVYQLKSSITGPFFLKKYKFSPDIPRRSPFSTMEF